MRRLVPNWRLSAPLCGIDALHCGLSIPTARQLAASQLRAAQRHNHIPRIRKYARLVCALGKL